MRAFIRAREVSSGNDNFFVAWFEPQHQIVETNALFFARRYARRAGRSSLPTLRALESNRRLLTFTPGITRGWMRLTITRWKRFGEPTMQTFSIPPA
jgi:DNA polymerase